ncbi:RagB/SusD family nutrient uptake outer membrane protein [Rapidithrix thailandica]|uniref:RagB/SusD family nutrient uptake outer membrane protein n=1 Tax=Rapidithrix thailandica TaxID=413964 RepID=A0AAW9S9F3_9BACT
MKFSIKYIIAWVAALLFFTTSCDEQLEVPLPSDSFTREEALKTKADLELLLNSAYDVFANIYNGRSQVLSALLADNIGNNFVDGNGFFREVYNRNTNFFNSEIGTYYKDPYKAIARANVLIEVVESGSIPDLDDASASRMKGEGLFIRAVMHFNLIRMMAQPYGYSSDNSHPGIALKVSSAAEVLPRASVKEVYDQVLQDLNEAIAILPAENGVYATSWAAKAFLARVYFQMNDFANAAKYAGEVIDGGQFELENEVQGRFSQDISTEAIFTTVSPGNNDNNAGEYTGKFRSDNAEPFLKPSGSIYEFITADAADKRSEWFEMKAYVDEGPEILVLNRYNDDFFNVAVIHLAEMLLTRAEALAAQNQNLNQALADLNVVRTRAGLSALSSGMTAQELVEKVREERRKELLLEGDRIQQIKRIGALGETSVVRGAPWNCPGMVLQFPASEELPGYFELNEKGGCQ